MGISHVVRRLGLKRKGKVWWITDLPIYYADGEGPFTECGPYDTRESAESDRIGMQAHLNKVGYYDEEEPSKPQVKRKEPSHKKTIVERKEEAKTFVEEEGLW